MEQKDAIQLFKYGEQNVRVLQGDDGEPRFVAADVCAVLEHSDTSMAVRGLDDDERGTSIVCTLGGPQEMSVITEAGLYSLVLRSRKPEAKAFRRWVTHEVLPAIRKHGGYLTPQKIEEALLNPDVIIRLATDLKAEREKRAALEAKIEADQPMVTFGGSVMVSKDTILIGELAKILRQNGIEIGQNRLFERLRQDGYLMKDGSSRNVPTQRSMEMGLLAVTETTIIRPDKDPKIVLTTRVTGKGQIYFVNRFLAEKKGLRVIDAPDGQPIPAELEKEAQ